jgi:hypothetical protein
VVFAARIAQHDNTAMSLVCNQLERVGALTSAFGIEIDNDALRQALRNQHDAMSLMLRYRPDRAVVVPKVRTILCEIKSVSGTYRNYSIEVDSYTAAREWHNGDRRVMYAFVDLDAEPPTIKACWFDALPPPHTIYVPTRQGYQATLQRIEQAWPDANVLLREHKRGSGTPYFLVFKGHTNLRPLEEFIANSILREQ